MKKTLAIKALSGIIITSLCMTMFCVAGKFDLEEFLIQKIDQTKKGQQGIIRAMDHGGLYDAAYNMTQNNYLKSVTQTLPQVSTQLNMKWSCDTTPKDVYNIFGMTNPGQMLIRKYRASDTDDSSLTMQDFYNSCLKIQKCIANVEGYELEALDAESSTTCVHLIENSYDAMLDTTLSFNNAQSENFGDEIFVNGTLDDSAFDLIIDVQELGKMFFLDPEEPDIVLMHDTIPEMYSFAGFEGQTPETPVFDIPDGDVYDRYEPIGPGSSSLTDEDSTDTGSAGGNTYCGDYYIQQPNSYGQYEECDDGNTVSGDGCDSLCKLEQGQNKGIIGTNQCVTGNTSLLDKTVIGTDKIAYCGDNIIQKPNTYGQEEECDDGKNCANGKKCTKDSQCTDNSKCQPRGDDGCSSSCTKESVQDVIDTYHNTSTNQNLQNIDPNTIQNQAQKLRKIYFEPIDMSEDIARYNQLIAQGGVPGLRFPVRTNGVYIKEALADYQQIKTAISAGGIPGPEFEIDTCENKCEHLAAGMEQTICKATCGCSMTSSIADIYKVRYCMVETIGNRMKGPLHGFETLNIEEMLDEYLNLLLNIRESGADFNSKIPDEFREQAHEDLEFDKMFIFDFVVKVKPMFDEIHDEEDKTREIKKYHEEKNKDFEKNILNFNEDITKREERNKYIYQSFPYEERQKESIAFEPSQPNQLQELARAVEKQMQRNQRAQDVLEDEQIRTNMTYLDEVKTFLDRSKEFWGQTHSVFANEIANYAKAIRIKVESSQ